MMSKHIVDTCHRCLSRPSFLLLVTFILLSVVTLTVDRMYYDEGMWNYIGNLWTMHGSPPYTGALENKTPGIFLVYALSNLLFGVNIFFPRFLGIAAILLTSWFLFRMTRKLSNPTAGIFAMILFAFTMPWYGVDGAFTSLTETFMVLFVVLSFSALLSSGIHKGTPNGAAIYLSGISMGMAIAFKQIAIFSALALFLFTLTTTRKEGPFIRQILKTYLILSAGIISSTLLTYLPLLAYGVSLSDYFKGAWLILLQKGTSTYLGERTWRFFLTWADSKILLFYPFLLIFVLNKPNLRKQGIPFWGLLIWVLCDFLGVNASGRYYGHQMKQLIPPLSITCGIALGILLDPSNLKKLAPLLGREGRDPATYQKSVFCLVVSLLFFLWVVLDPQTHVTVSRLMKKKEEKARTLASRIQDLTEKDDPIYLWRLQDGAPVYAYADRRAPTRFFTQHFIHIPGGEMELQKDLKRTPPKIIVMEREEKDIPPWLTTFCRDRYTLLPEEQDHLFWKLNPN